MSRSRLFSIIGAGIVKELSRGQCTAFYRTSFMQRPYSARWQPQVELHPETKGHHGTISQKHRQFSSTATSSDSADGSDLNEMISVAFVDKDGEETDIKVPIGMSMLEAAHENDIELEGKDYNAIFLDQHISFLVDYNWVLCFCNGACEGSLACSTCHVIVTDMEYYNKLEDPTDEENDMLDLAFGLTETSRLGCQVIAKPELNGMRIALPAATRNFAVDGYVPKPH
uniref:2Fe-2S ferredoxin-type domain-containing protein n=1 Tax=Salix viminalis TaxID=40686 RepID=A0A6N2K2D3_SALVM